MTDNIVFEDSPLAAYLEGEGTRLPNLVPVQNDSHSQTPPSQSFAPSGPSRLQSVIRDRLRQPLRIHIPTPGAIQKLRSKCSHAVNSRLGRVDNARFLEHFRYIIVASQILDEESAKPDTKTLPVHNDVPAATNTFDNDNLASASLIGALCTGVAAFALVWLLHWARGSSEAGLSAARLLIVGTMIGMGATIVYGYVRKQRLYIIRQGAVRDESVLITNLQALHQSISSALTLVQEVELVSRGYRLSSPLPPISRLEEKSPGRRCAKLRKSARMGFVTVLQTLQNNCKLLHTLVDNEDLDKYLDIYDVNHLDIQEAKQPISVDDFDDWEGLKALRIMQFRVTILKRILLCSLLALEADGGTDDFLRWQTAIDVMRQTATAAGDMSENLNGILAAEDQFGLPTTPKMPQSPGRERIRTQIRKLGSLSHGIRGIQAKMQILREESDRALEESDEVIELSSSLMSHYDSIGTDLKNLLQAWESGKAALALNIGRHEHRLSHASSSGLRSPVSSIGGLTAVDEGVGSGSGSPSEALLALNGQLPPRRHSQIIPSSSSNTSDKDASNMSSDEEIFEAIAMPRRRLTMSREERQAKILEDRVRQAAAREQREASTSMIRELESVINLRPKQTPPSSRVTSL